MRQFKYEVLTSSAIKRIMINQIRYKTMTDLTPSNTPGTETMSDDVLDQLAEEFELEQEEDGQDEPSENGLKVKLRSPYTMTKFGEPLYYIIYEADDSLPILPPVMVQTLRKEGVSESVSKAPYAWLRRNLLVLKKDELGEYKTNGDTPPEMLSEIEGIADDRRNVIARLSAAELNDGQILQSLGLSGSAAELKLITKGQLQSGGIETVKIVRDKGWVKVDGNVQYIYGANTIARTKPVDPDVRASDRVKASGEKGDCLQLMNVLQHLYNTNPQQAFFAGFAAAAPAISRIGDAEPGIINIYGESSKGKTTTLQTIAALLGRATKTTDGASYMKGWRSTDNGLEQPMAYHNDCVLLLDELHQADNKMDWQSTAYMLANGRGKQRMTRNGLEADVSSWCAQVISTGEVSFAEKVRAVTKGELAGGLQFRILDIYAGSIELFSVKSREEMEVWGDLLGVEVTNGRDLSEALEAFFENNYGYIWDLLIDGMIKDDCESFAANYSKHRADLLALLPTDASPVVQRRTKHVAAAMAGLEALGKILCVDDNAIANARDFAMKHVLPAGLADLSTTEGQGIEEAITAAMFANADKISDTSTPARNTGAEGAIGWKDKEGNLNIPTRTGWPRLCRSVGIDPDRARDIMIKSGWSKDRKRAPGQAGKVMVLVAPKECVEELEANWAEDVNL